MKKLYRTLLLLVCMHMFVQKGNAQISAQIVGGRDADISEVPWQVLLEINGQDQCGGSIIAPGWILTAAHCLDDRNINDLRVIAGITNRNQKNTGQIRTVVQIIRHPGYNRNNPNSRFDNDVALLRLNNPLSLNNNVQTIDFATQADANAGFMDPGVVATVSGWGELVFQGNRPNILQLVNVPIVANSTAQAQWIAPFNVTNNMIAAGELNQGGRGSCRGDSGGPLVVRAANNRTILAGVVSYGRPCATAGAVDLYTRVSRYCNWITQQIASVTGPAVVCTSGGTFILQNPLHVTSVTSVTWTASANLTPSSGNGATATVSAISGSISSSGWVDFTIAGACGNVTVRKTIWVGPPGYPTFSWQGNIAEYEVCPSHTVYISANALGATNGYHWQVISGTLLQDNGDHIVVRSPAGVGQLLQVQVTPLNGCPNGATYTFTRQVADMVDGQYCYDEGFAVTASPNPAANQLTVQFSSTQEQQVQVKLYNTFSRVVAEGDTKGKSITLNTRQLPEGSYFLHVIHRGGVTRRQIMIKR